MLHLIAAFDNSPAASDRTTSMTRARLFQFAMVALFAATVVAMMFAGWHLRRWTWDNTVSIRYAPDMRNAWKWGGRAAREGYFSLYDDVVNESSDNKYGLDYVPLRLGVMTLWARWANEKFPDTPRWQNTYDFNAPLLRLNASMEFASAVGMFLLVRQWIRRERLPRPENLWRSWARFATRWSPRRVPRFGTPNRASTASSPGTVWSTKPWHPEEPSSSPPIPFFHGHWLALFAAALVWFNPAAIFSSFARPTWDVWVIPFYVWAIFFAARNNWFFAGAIVGIGAMLKGQQLIIAPLFLLWPILSLRFGAAMRWTVGLALAVGLIVSPWQVWRAPTWGPIVLCVGALLFGPALWAMVWIALRLARSGKGDIQNIPPRKMDEPGRAEGYSGCPLSRGPRRRWFRARWAVWISAFALAASLVCMPQLFDVSIAWLKVGFIYGVDKMPALESGGASSIAALLQHRHRWQSDDPADVPFVANPIAIKTLLTAIGYALIAVCAGAAAWHARQRDRRLLLAVAAPWLVYFAVFPMMHERYLLWAALMSAAAGSTNFAALCLHLLITALSWTMQLNQMLYSGNRSEFATGISPTFGQSLYRFTQGTVPDVGWAVALICLMWLYLMFAASGRRDAIL